MSRDDDTPPRGRPALRMRTPATPQRGTPIVERGGGGDLLRDRHVPKHVERDFDWEEATGQKDGEELERIRNNRPTDRRIAHVERRVDRIGDKVDRLDDKLSGKIGAVEVAVAALDATVKAEGKSTAQAVKLLGEALEASRADKHMVLKQTFDLTNAESKGRIDTKVISTTGRWKVLGIIASGLFSASVLGALVALAAQGRC